MGWGRGCVQFCIAVSSSWVGKSLHTEFQLTLRRVSGPTVCGGWVVVVCKPISVLSLDQAEQKFGLLMWLKFYCKMKCK